MAGYDPAEADEWLIAIAEQCLDDCYYLDRAAEELMRRTR